MADFNFFQFWRRLLFLFNIYDACFQYLECYSQLFFVISFQFWLLKFVYGASAIPPPTQRVCVGARAHMHFLGVVAVTLNTSHLYYIQNHGHPICIQANKRELKNTGGISLFCYLEAESLPHNCYSSSIPFYSSESYFPCWSV